MKNAILLAVNTGQYIDFDYRIEEMERLIEANDMTVCAKSIQNLPAPNPATYFGVGKLDEVNSLLDMLEIDACIVADTLSPAQLKNMADILDILIIDRTGLILEIFKNRAGTREARLQVETANLQYLLPRLVGMRKTLGRQGGTSGSMSNKGQGEKQIELDRRHIEKRIVELNKELSDIENNRNVQRKARSKGNIPLVALVGYTNAGKSTLMNKLLTMSGAEDDKKVFEKDMLFATLDTTVRRISLGDKKDFLLSDTVGFVSDLPHALIKAFRTTLAEAALADLILIVLDSSDENVNMQKEITEKTLSELKCDEVPKLYVYNKIDILNNVYPFSNMNNNSVRISAATGDGLKELINRIQAIIYKDNIIVDVIIPYMKGYLLDLINNNAEVKSLDYMENGVHIIADCPAWLAGKVNSEIY